MSEQANATNDPRIYLALERTYLAWLRTGIALMGFGFVVARFGLFLRELTMNHELITNQAAAKDTHASFSLPVGVLLILLGILVMTVAAIRHHRLIQAADRGDFRQSFAPAFGFWLAGILAVIGMAVAAYLIVVY